MSLFIRMNARPQAIQLPTGSPSVTFPSQKQSNSSSTTKVMTCPPLRTEKFKRMLEVHY